MSQATLQSKGVDQFAVVGELSFATVTPLLATSRSLFADAASLNIDLSGVAHADSAGLALLLEWLSYGKRENKTVSFLGLPAQLRSLASISEVEGLLGSLT